MKSLLFLIATIIYSLGYSQVKVDSKKFGVLEFTELNYGLAKAIDSTVERLDKSPTGTHGWLKDLEILKVTDSIKIESKAKFGVVYIINSKDTVDIDVTIEWIYPAQITNEDGKKFESIKYTTTRPTNIPSGSTYSLDAPYEMVKGNWIENIYLENKRVFTRTFILY